MTWWCNVSSDTLQNATLAALQCSQEQDGSCVALCPNPDISGVGVRSAFYIQSLMNSKSRSLSSCGRFEHGLRTLVGKTTGMIALSAAETVVFYEPFFQS